MACTISMFVSAVLFFIDTFIAKEYASSILEVVSIACFAFFYYQAKYKGRFEKMLVPFLIVLMLIMNAAWFTGGGLNMTNAFVFFLILLLSLIITPYHFRPILLVVIFVNLVVFNALEFLYPAYSRPVIKNDNMLAINTIVMVLIFSIIAYIIVFFKNQYDKERDLVSKKNLELDAVNSEIETQNEELFQYQEEVMTQRDFIEEKNKMLEKQAMELEHANDQVKAANASLEKTVEQRTKELITINNDLDLLVYRSSHDFRRPLTTLMGLNEVARLTLVDDFSKELFAKVHNTALMMDKMLLKFFMLYNINHFRTSYEGSSLDEIIARIEKHLVARKRNISFTKEIKLESYGAHDERNNLIEIILENLFENSLIYNSKDSMVIKSNIYEEGGYLRIQHYDNGNGIPKSYQSQVFDMYFRGSTLSTGNGLGLYVVKRAADLLKATIRLDSQEGEFTKFDISFKI
jgi:signal transduction histidine kinase